MRSFYLIVKKGMDKVLCVLLLIATSWLVLLIMVAYLLSFEFPVFFIQARIGKNERIFKLIKFRTLRNVDLPLPQRRFLLGDFLRFTSLDELPQLFNILKGDMSFIGPRPLPAGYLSFFSEAQRRRHSVLPGITGWAQVNGRHSIRWQKKFMYDIVYVDSLSLLMDVRIFVKTIVLFFSFRKDISLQEKPFTKEDNA